MTFLQKLRSWWNRDAVEQAEEETRMTPSERDVDQEDFEARKDDLATRSGYFADDAADFERDSERPRDQ